MKERLATLIARGGPSDEADFEAAALELYRWQVANNEDYRAFCEGVAPRRWTEIPAVPVGLFRELALTCFPPELARHVFRTSGTTAERAGLHRLLDTDLYDLGARLHAESSAGPIPRRAISLVTPAAHSSLGHMVRLLAPETVGFFDPEGGLDAPGACSALRAASAPVFLPATAFAMADLLDALAGEVLALPAGSVVMVTGGFKGRRLELSDAVLAARVAATFPGARHVAEYGMTELSSQLWGALADRLYAPPRWLRALAVDPESGEPARQGLLRFVDLANHQTVLAIETQDLGEVLPDGRVRLLGRLPAAPARGCSLDAERARGPS